MSTTETFQDRLVFAMKKKDIKQVDIVRKLKVSRGTASNWYSGKTEPEGPEQLARLADLLGVDIGWLAKGENKVVNSGIFVGGNNVNHGTQIGTQTLTQTVMADDVAGVPSESLNLKPLPYFDIDDAVSYALADDTTANDGEIVERAKESTIFIATDSRAFGVLVAYELDWVKPTPVHAGEILVIEPCMPPRSGDLVLVCLGYPNNQRGIVARLHADINNQYSIQYDENKPVPMPTGSLICGVVRKTSRELISGSIVQSRLDKEYQPIKSLVG